MKRRLVVPASALVLALLAFDALAAGAPLGYYRFPAIHAGTIVFTAEGDLYKVSVEGGTAERLTSHPGMESNAAISPDGAVVAFSATYEGPTEVYVMPLAGGLPRRLTWDGSATVLGWTPDGKVLYATTNRSTLPDAQLSTVDPASGARETLPLSQAAEGSYDFSGRTLFFSRLRYQGSHTRRYKGGTAQKIWKLAPGAAEAVCLTADFDGTSRWPMGWRGRVYFVSDRDGTLNVWSMDESGGDLMQHTRHDGWDVSSPSLSDGKIAYQLGADLWVLDLATGKDAAIAVTLASDLDQTRERWVKKPMEYLTSAHLSPDGDRVALTARGQVFVAPARQGRIVEATRRPGVRYRQARFLPDGKSLAVLSDESGEVEWWKLPANGVGAGDALTSDGKVLRFDGVPSPDGKRIAYHDKNQELWILDLEKKKSTRIATSRTGEFLDLAWSPDGAWLAYVAPGDNELSRIWLHRPADGTTVPLTSDRTGSASPAWTPDGKWLYFLSDRELRSLVGSPWGDRQPEPFFDRITKIYLVDLPGGQRSPWQPSDELAPKEAKAQDDKDKDKDKEKEKDQEGEAGDKPKGSAGAKPKDKAVVVKIELDGLDHRVQEVPLPADNYENLSAGEKRLFFEVRETSFERKARLAYAEVTSHEPKVKTLVPEVKGYEPSQDGKKLLVRKGDDLYVIESSAEESHDLSEKKVSLDGWTFALDPREEWRQMFREAWRLERDYFYDRSMHGVDWPAMRGKFEPLVARVTDRAELNDLLGQMVAELSALHMFVRGGDLRETPDPVANSSLGAELDRDTAAGGYRIRRIFRADPDYPGELSPLAKPAVGAAEGDVLTAIDGVALLTVPDPGVLLRAKAGKQVLLTIRETKSGKTRDAIAVPLPGAAADLRYDDWETTRRLEVEEKGKGDLGYVHLRAMGGSDYSDWARNFYPVYRRKGLIVDVRHNRGGNIDSWILEKLMRRAWFYWQPRVGAPIWNMQYAFRGPVVVLVDEWTASDGEAFAEGFRRLGLGKVIGTRTWGGEIWLSSNNVLVDKGIATAAESGVFGPEGQWLIEGRGVEPDVIVDNLPRATFDGKDAQLEAAIAYLRETLQKQPVEEPKPPRYPDKSR
ncbi:MAG: PDZ domain-containing protein [Acidobacteriia bacterium]|nr:PDZ domain-containing protein [Terriglobia bacterium]